jgi:hypothetical protein
MESVGGKVLWWVLVTLLAPVAIGLLRAPAPAVGGRRVTAPSTEGRHA